jgi:hypothetical protein
LPASRSILRPMASSRIGLVAPFQRLGLKRVMLDVTPDLGAYLTATGPGKSQDGGSTVPRDEVRPIIAPGAAQNPDKDVMDQLNDIGLEAVVSVKKQFTEGELARAETGNDRGEEASRIRWRAPACPNRRSHAPHQLRDPQDEVIRHP